MVVCKNIRGSLHDTVRPLKILSSPDLTSSVDVVLEVGCHFALFFRGIIVSSSSWDSLLWWGIDTVKLPPKHFSVWSHDVNDSQRLLVFYLSDLVSSLNRSHQVNFFLFAWPLFQMLTLMSCDHWHLVVLLWRIVTGVKAVHKDGVVLAGDIFHHCSLVFAFKTVNEDRVRVVIDGWNIDRHLVILLRNSCFLLDLHLDLLRLVVLD